LSDILRGRQTEVDAINGAVVRSGEKIGVPTPINWTVWKLIKSLENVSKDEVILKNEQLVRVC
ncbi:MAG: ketopantoate reductase family protein, partial [Anaerolineales bacterium]